MRSGFDLRAMAPTLGLVALAALVWALPLRLGYYQDGVLSDLGVYEEAGALITSGELPYRDFALEYPPGAAALFVFAEPWPGKYGIAFSVLMLIALIVTVIFTVAAARALQLGRARTIAAGAIVAISPLLIGALVETRFDLALSAALAVLLYGAAARRFGIAWCALALGALIKLIPLALIPILFVYHWHRDGPRRALIGAGSAVGVFVLVFIPFLIASPSGTLELVRYHLDRPLQIESTGAAYLLGLHALADIELSVENSFGSQNLVGDGPDVIAAISTAIGIVLVVAIAVSLALGLRRATPPGDARLFVAAAAATLVALLVAGKVLSPQFLLWLLPAALLVAGPFGWGAVGATVAALVVTQAYFPYSYWDLVAFDTIPIVVLVVRDLTLIALLALAWPRPRIAREPYADAASRASPGAFPGRYILD